MLASIFGGEINGSVNLPFSKSYIHRLLILSSLSDRETLIYCNTDCGDVSATVSCLKSLGAEIRREAYGFIVTPVWGNLQKNPTFPCGESGSTLRFLLPVASVLSTGGLFVGEGRLGERPMTALLSELRDKGMTISGDFPYSVSGRLKGGLFNIDGNISSQFITGLLLALPLCEEDSEIRISGRLQSKDYVELTLELLDEFSIKTERKGNSIFIMGKQRFISQGKYLPERDWSSAGYFIIGGLLAGTVNLPYLSYPSVQGDSKLLKLMLSAGGKISFNYGFTIEKSELKAIDFDCSDIPDSVPILAVACAYAEGTSVLRNVERLRYKESDRLSGICEMLSRAGVENYTDGNNLTIKGTKNINNAVFDGKNDHRMVMSAAILSLLSPKESTITDAEAVKKSYPQFFEDFKALGVNVNVGK